MNIPWKGEQMYRTIVRILLVLAELVRQAEEDGRWAEASRYLQAQRLLQDELRRRNRAEDCWSPAPATDRNVR